jgi:hypothetical protein
MLTKNRNVPSASADATTKSARREDVADRQERTSPIAVIHEPKVDWVPLAWAPFRYNPYGYFHSHEQWGENLRVKVKNLLSSSSSLDVPTLEYSFRQNKWEVMIDAGGILTCVAANSGWVFAFYNESPPVTVGGDPDEFLSIKNWNEFPPKQKSAIAWHLRLVRGLLSSLRRDFGEALHTGSAQIMARKNSILAPFERVAWDQWSYFKLDTEPERPSWENQQYSWVERVSPLVRWFDPRNCGWEPRGYTPSTATGPNGERLYAIHVAPGVGRAESGEISPEEKCIQWLVESMTAFPERSPKTREALIEEAVSKFPGLTERGFGRSLFSARRQTGNLKWITSGRRRKSPR